MSRLSLAFLVAVAFVLRLSAKDPELPTQERALAALASSFVEPPKQIPATVVDVGHLKFIPYVSYRIGEDRELNVYGDPAAPACVEIGLYRGLLRSESEKLRCIRYLQGIFPFVDLRGLRLDGSKSMRGGVVVEVTTPDAPDAYGGWWISVYSLPRLADARGTAANVQAVSVPRESAVVVEEWSEAEMRYARPAPEPEPAPQAKAMPSVPTPSASNRIATPSTPRPAVSSAPSSSGGRVYVRGYTRKDGTYVRPHTRRR